MLGASAEAEAPFTPRGAAGILTATELSHTRLSKPPQ